MDYEAQLAAFFRDSDTTIVRVLRWHIENNELKRLSHLAGIKTVYFKDPRPFCFVLTAFDAFFDILHRAGQALKALMQGCEFT